MNNRVTCRPFRDVAAGNGVANLVVGLSEEYDNGHYVPWQQHMIEEEVCNVP